MDWKTKTFAMSWLRSKATDTIGVFPWLKSIGVVPENTNSLPATFVRNDVDPEALTAEYIGRSAYEWDNWGASTPLQFLDAISVEFSSSPDRITIAALLTSLGRVPAETVETWS